MRPTILAALPALVLVAQAPAPTDLRQQFNAELPGINQLLKTFQAKAAMDKAASLIPAQAPAFDGANLQTIVRSLEQGQGLLSMYRLAGSTAVAAGQWEKAQELQEKRLAAAQAIRDEVNKSQAPIQAVWDKAVADGQAYITANQPRQADLMAKVKAFTAEFDAVKADMAAGKRKLSKQEADDINARGKVAGEQEQEANQIAATIKLHQDNQVKAKTVAKFLAENVTEANGMVKAAEDDLAKVKSNIASQAKEIADFNALEAKKKVKVVGNRTWVDAVLRNHENLTKLGTPQDQAGFLNRLLVLDPGNPMAEKALRNVTEGKDPFAKDSKPVRKVHPKKK
ncbi:MAG TPA: hypothetical protein VF804_09745 [Holophagaceae bacterium]